MQLREYQTDAIRRAARALAGGTRRLLLVAPTGAGKTVVAAEIIRRAHTKGRRVVFFAHRRELIHQTRRKLIDAGVPADAIGVLMAADPLSDPSAPIQVASIDTWRHRDPPAADLVMIDEAHRSLAATYVRAVEHYTAAGAAVIGLTATPFRADGGGLGEIYETMELVSTPSELIAEGYLVAPRVFSVPPEARPDLSGVRVRLGDYSQAQLERAVNREELVAGIVDQWIRRAEGRRTVAFAAGVAHSQAIAAAFVAEGIAAEHLDGTTPTAERDAILARLQSGETRIVSNCGVLTEGWDQPAVKCCILARPTKSTGLYLQMAGRILRPWEGVGALILDHAGNALAHGLPQDDRHYELASGRASNGTGAPPTKECPECHAVLPLSARECTECGFVFPRAEAPEINGQGDLVEVLPLSEDELVAGWDEIVDWWRQANAYRPKPLKRGWIWHRFLETYGRKPPKRCKLPVDAVTTDEMERVLLDLEYQAAQRGYKTGWVRHRFRARYGVDPSQLEARE